VSPPLCGLKLFIRFYRELTIIMVHPFILILYRKNLRLSRDFFNFIYKSIFMIVTYATQRLSQLALLREFSHRHGLRRATSLREGGFVWNFFNELMP
jgi:hypothetical protein